MSGHVRYRDVDVFLTEMIPSIALWIRKELCRFGRLKFKLILATEAFGDEIYNDTGPVIGMETVYFQCSWTRIEGSIKTLMKVDDFIRYINNTLYVRHICHGWNFKRCILLQLNIKRCPCDVKIPRSLGNMSAALINEMPQLGLYVQATSCLPLHVLKLLNVKPNFVMQELQLISDVSRVYRRLQYLRSDSLQTLSTTMLKMGKRVSWLLWL